MRLCHTPAKGASDLGKELAELREAVAILLGDAEVGDRVVALIPALAARLAGRVPEHADQPRRNVAPHAEIPARAPVSRASPRQLRQWQRLARLEARRFGAGEGQGEASTAAAGAEAEEVNDDADGGLGQILEGECSAQDSHHFIGQAEPRVAQRGSLAEELRLAAACEGPQGGASQQGRLNPSLAQRADLHRLGRIFQAWWEWWPYLRDDGYQVASPLGVDGHATASLAEQGLGMAAQPRAEADASSPHLGARHVLRGVGSLKDGGKTPSTAASGSVFVVSAEDAGAQQAQYGEATVQGSPRHVVLTKIVRAEALSGARADGFLDALRMVLDGGGGGPIDLAATSWLPAAWCTVAAERQ
ncbi:unnamed protein product, partial [Prorocentrum cordatum]